MMKDMLAAFLFVLLAAFTLGWWNPRVVVQHGSAPPDTVTVRMIRGAE